MLRRTSPYTPKMDHPLLAALPIVSSIFDEAYRVALTIWVLPWAKDTVDGWIQILIFLRAVFVVPNNFGLPWYASNPQLHAKKQQ